jgi:hypothetical protein
MNRYRVRLNGRDLLLKLDGQVQVAGFYLNVVVHARSAADAEPHAINVAQQELMKRIGTGPHDSLPVILVDEVEPLDWRDPQPLGSQGFIFYVNPEAHARA